MLGICSLNSGGLNKRKVGCYNEVWKLVEKVIQQSKPGLKNGYTNVLIHELTHVANDYDKIKILFGLIERHCSDNVSTCIWRSEINSNFYDSQWHNRIKYTYKGERYEYPSPWHSLDEINEMRESMKLSLLQP